MRCPTLDFQYHKITLEEKQFLDFNAKVQVQSVSADLTKTVETCLKITSYPIIILTLSVNSAAADLIEY